ncbi:MAG: hypothetical protein WCQ87_05800 [Parabacteroides sp.]
MENSKKISVGYLREALANLDETGIIEVISSFQLPLYKSENTLTFQELLEAITVSHGVSLEQLRSENKKQTLVFCRMVFSYYLSSWGWKHGTIAAVIGKDRSTISWQVRQYAILTKCNSAFRSFARTIADNLNQIHQSGKHNL